MKSVGLSSYAFSEKSSSNSLGKAFTQDEIRTIIIDNSRGEAYEEQESFDNILNGIKQFCYLYLDDEKHVDSLELKRIEYALSFLHEHFNKLNDLQSSLSLTYYSWPFTELAQSIDEFTLSSSKKSYVHEVVEAKMSKDITNALDIVSFCFGVMRLAKKTKIQREKIEKYKKEQ